MFNESERFLFKVALETDVTEGLRALGFVWWPKDESNDHLLGCYCWLSTRRKAKSGETLEHFNLNGLKVLSLTQNPIEKNVNSNERLPLSNPIKRRTKHRQPSNDYFLSPLKHLASKMRQNAAILLTLIVVFIMTEATEGAGKYSTFGPWKTFRSQKFPFKHSAAVEGQLNRRPPT